MENKELSKNKYGIEYTKVGDFYLPNIALPKARRTGNIGSRANGKKRKCYRRIKSK